MKIHIALKATALSLLCLLTVACTQPASKAADTTAPKPATSATSETETETKTEMAAKDENAPQEASGENQLAQSWTLINFGAPW